MGPVTIDDYGHGGVGVCRVDGKVHFVEGALPGDVVHLDVTVDKRTWARATIAEVVEAGPDRRDAPCPHAAACGGCDLQQARDPAQHRWKRDVVVQQLRRPGGVADPVVHDVVAASPPFGYRNRMDFSVAEGRPALHRRSSSELVALGVCLLLAPPLAEWFERLGDLGGATGLTMRAGLRTGDRLAVVAGDLPEGWETWEVPVCRVRRGRAESVAGPDHLHEEVAGVRLRITASAFFQNSTDGAESLVALVGEAIADRRGTLVDLFAGGGLFALTVGGPFERVVAVESAGMAVADLRHNVARIRPDVEVHAGRVEALGLSTDGDVTVVVDPPRAGLARDGVRALAGLGADRVVYVSCEPASLGRDVALLADLGYRLHAATPVDLFPQTHHVETVAVLDR